MCIMQKKQSEITIVHRELAGLEPTPELKREVEMMYHRRTAQVSGFQVRLQGNKAVAIGKRNRRINWLAELAEDISEFYRDSHRSIPNSFAIYTVTP